MRRRCTSLRMQPRKFVRSSRKFSLGKIIIQWWKTCTVVNLYFQGEESKTEGWPLWKNDESPLKYYNITPTFILEVKLRVSTSHTHNVFSLLTLHFFLFAAARTSFHFLCLALALTRTHLLSCHALLVSFYSVFSERSSRMDRLSRNPLSLRIFFSSRPYARARFSWPNALCRRQWDTWNSRVAHGEMKIRRICRTNRTRSKIAKYFAELCVQWKFLCSFTMKQSRVRITLSADRVPQCAITFLQKNSRKIWKLNF